MALQQVIAPLQASATAGAGVKVTTVSASNVTSSITINAPEEANGILVTNAGTASGTAGTLIFARVSAEASPTATSADVPVGFNQSVLLQNPVPVGKVGIAVKGVSSTANDVYFTPVEIKLGT
jgi:hypothetical protein